MSVDLLGDPKGFNAVLTDKDKIYPMGSQVKFSKNLRINTRIPVEPKDFYELVLFKDGERALTVNVPEFSYEVKEPGVYRVTVRISPMLPIPDGKKWVTWIYTNHFYIR